VLPSAEEEPLLELLAGFSTLGCQLHDGPRDVRRARIYFEPEHEKIASRLVSALTELGAEGVRLQALAGQDWLASYRDQITAFAVGRVWWIDPHPGRPSPAPEGRMRLVIEPRAAFGTGSHESTQLVLKELERIAGADGSERSLSLSGLTVLDAGTGSGVLALAADRLGASWVVGLDHDPEAIWVARETSLDQEWPSRSRLLVGPVRSVAGGKFDLVLCNMLLEELLTLLSPLRSLLADSGLAVLSGMLSEQRRAAVEAIEDSGFRVVREHAMGEWMSMTVAVGIEP